MKEFLGMIVGFFVIVFVIGVISLGGLYLGSAFNLITLPWQKFDSKVNMNSQIIQKTYNADNALYNYHWFQERQGSISALADQILTAKQRVTDFEISAAPLRKDWTFEDKNEDARLHAVLQGLENERNSQIKEYNARAGEADRNIFQNGLPLFINLN